MKIAFLGNFNVDFSSETHWAKSIEALGHKVLRIQETSSKTDEILTQALASDVFVWVHTHGVDIGGVRTMEEVLGILKKEGIPSVAYHLDLYMGLERWKEYDGSPYLNSVEHFFTVDKLMADWLNKNTKTKGHYLPAGVFHSECVMKPKQMVDFDIVFTGSKGYHPEHPYRPQLIEFLYDTYGRRFIHIGGDGEVSPQRGMNLNQVYSNAKIVVGDTLQLNFDYPYYYSDRFFEVPGRGGFCIFPNIKGTEECFEPGKEMVFYEHGNLTDLRDKIDYYLDHAREREDIRQAGFERAKRDHTYLKRWEHILEVVSGKN